MNDYERSRLYRFDSGQFWFTFWLAGERKHVRCPPDVVTQRAGERWAADYLARLRDRGSRGPRLRDYAEGWFEPGSPWVVRKEIGESWARSRKLFLTNHVLPLWGDYRLMDLDPVSVENELLRLDLAGRTRNMIRETLLIMVREARRQRLIPFDPLAESERLPEHSRARSVFTAKEIRELFPDNLSPWRPPYGLVGYAMYSSGMRAQEVQALSPAAVRPGGLLVLRAVKANGTLGSTKNEDTRSTLTTDRALEYLKHHRASSELLFPGVIQGKDGRPVSYRPFYDAFMAALKETGIDVGDRWLTPHSLRHTWRTEMRRLELARKIDKGSVDYMMGHKSAGIVERYVHLRPEEALEVLQEYRPAINEALA